ncbi:MAG: TauD/TfdA family dioxygenase [Proteobacteria bacterium]|nr:TauD/TfdA family dioxygenase [Pseudomonadota bacterium]
MNVLAREPAIKVQKLKDHVGAIITGVDLTKPMDKATFDTVYDALLENVAVAIRGNILTPAQYQATAEQFGELMEDQNRLYLVEGHPLISVLSNRHKASDGKPAKVANNATWHTDHTNQEYPPKFTMLYAVELPDSGGGTAVCNMRAAYESLPEEKRRQIVDMKTENTLISSARMEGANPDIVKAQKASTKPPTIQPLVRTHPDTGTKAIWFHKAKTERIIGMEPQETQDFLEDLLQTAIRPEFHFVHEWQVGDMLIIDNRSAMHKAGFDFDRSQHRHLRRILVRGDRPS